MFIRRMAATLQPTTAAGFDRSSPIAHRLIAGCNLGGSRFDLVRPGVLFGRAAVVSNIFGRGALTDAAGQYVTQSAPLSFAAGASFTCLFAVGNPAFNGSNPGVWRSTGAATEFCIFQGSSGLPWIRINGSDVLKPGSGFAITAGVSTCFGFRVRSSVDAAFASNGVIRHTATHAIATPAFTINDIGYQGSSPEALSGTYSTILFWDRALNDTEFAAATSRPWQAQAQSTIAWDAPPVGGGGGGGVPTPMLGQLIFALQ